MELDVMVKVTEDDEYLPGKLTDELDSSGQTIRVQVEGESIWRGPEEVVEVDASDAATGEDCQSLLERAIEEGFAVRTLGGGAR